MWLFAVISGCAIAASCVQAAFLFPIGTVMQIVAGISWPVAIPDRKMFMNLGFQFNYNLPVQPSTLYNPVYFPYSRALLDAVLYDGESSNSTSTTSEPAVGGNVTNTIDQTQTRNSRQPRAVRRRNGVTDLAPEQLTALYEKYGQADAAAGRVQRDMSAGELYQSFEQMLADAGFDSTCLLKSVCQLSRHPLHLPADEEDLLAEMLHFILTPSAHQSFDAHESYLRDRYETAEEIGHSLGDCEAVYSECATSPLDFITSLSAHQDPSPSPVENEINK